MTAKANAHHVVNLALVPIGGLPNRSDAGQLGLLLAHIRFETEMTAMAVAIKLINHGKTRVVAVIVHAADVHEVIEAEFLFREPADPGDLLRIEQFQRDFAAELLRFGQQIAELGSQFLGEFKSSHGKNFKFENSDYGDLSSSSRRVL